MKPPSCPFCPVVEWRHVCGGVANNGKAVANKVANRFPLIPLPEPETVCVTSDKPIQLKYDVPKEFRSRYKDPEKRKTYMRELMRKRRAVG